MTVFILIDTSGSMAGEAMSSLLRHLRLLKDLMSKHQSIRERVDVSLIGFGSEACLLAVPASSATIEFPTELEASGSTATGAAIELMLGQRNAPLAASSAPRLAPVVLLVSDGVATDDFEDAIGKMGAFPWSARVAWALSGADLFQLERFVGDQPGRFSHLSLFQQGTDAGAVSRFCAMLSLILGSQDLGGDGYSVPVRRGPDRPSASKAY